MKEKCNHEHTVVVVEQWSEACLDCGCYCYDFSDNWQNKEGSLERLMIQRRWTKSQSVREIIDKCIKILKERTSQ